MSEIQKEGNAAALIWGLQRAFEQVMSEIYTIAAGVVKGKPKHQVDRACLRENHGLEGDCHAGPGSRQISLLAWENVLALQKQGISATPGDFAENIDTEGLDFSTIQVGARLTIGDAVLEITEIGKSDWKEGDYSFKGIALVARSGLFARVIDGGWIHKGDEIIVLG